MLVVALLSILMTSCQSSQSQDSLAPYQPEIGNKPDSFQFQVTGVRNVTTTVEYSWQNSATMATVNQSSAVSGGSATVLLYDADKIQRYTKNLGDNGTFRSEAGKTGAWKIQVVLNNFSGTLNFRVQKQ
jgi:hypothetical protein